MRTELAYLGPRATCWLRKSNETWFRARLLGDDSPRECTPGPEWSRTRLLVPSGRGFESPLPPSPSFGQIMAQMLFGRFWLQNKDLGLSLGAIDIIFRDLSVESGPGAEFRPARNSEFGELLFGGGGV